MIQVTTNTNDASGIEDAVKTEDKENYSAEAEDDLQIIEPPDPSVKTATDKDKVCNYFCYDYKE